MLLTTGSLLWFGRVLATFSSTCRKYSTWLINMGGQSSCAYIDPIMMMLSSAILTMSLQLQFMRTRQSLYWLSSLGKQEYCGHIARSLPGSGFCTEEDSGNSISCPYNATLIASGDDWVKHESTQKLKRAHVQQSCRPLEHKQVSYSLETHIFGMNQIKKLLGLVMTILGAPKRLHLEMLHLRDGQMKIT